MRYLLFYFISIFLFSCNNDGPAKRTTVNSTSAVVLDNDAIRLKGKVVAIADGDTFTFLINGNQQEKVRLHGIDCPEKKQDFGSVAKQKLSDLIFGKYISIQRMDKDRYGRTIAMIYDEKGKNINEEMLRLGLAWHYKKYDDNPKWASFEEEARRTKKGLWSHPNPIAPWEWRKR